MRHIRLILILILIVVFSSCNSDEQTVQETENNTVNDNHVVFNDEVKLAQIRHDISTMTYIGETLGYYIYDMNVYRAVVDKHTGQPYFNYESGLATYNVVLDTKSPENHKIFMPLYIVG
jgi:hypothetical protein